MAIVNRTLDASQQRDVLNFSMTGGTGLGYGSGKTFLLGAFPRACVIEAVRIGAVGLSSTPFVALSVNRFVSTGSTNIGSSIAGVTLQSIGATGLQSMLISSSQLAQAGDWLVATLTGATTAFDSACIQVVVRNLQDIRTSFGV